MAHLIIDEPKNIDMGLGQIGQSGIVFKRKFRWTFEIERFCNGQSLHVPSHFVKLASRPNVSIDETEINFRNGKMWIPGKGTWETITVTYYDVGGTDAGNGLINLYSWLASVYDFTHPNSLFQGSKKSDYSGKGILILYDGCGDPIEQWVLDHMWPQSINFGDLDYSASEEVNVELTLRYSSVQYQSFCPKTNIKGCCSPCKAGPFVGPPAP